MPTTTLPKTNQTGTNEWADVEDNDTTLLTAIDNTNAAYRTIFAAGGSHGSAIAAGTYLLTSGGTMSVSGSDISEPVPSVHFAAADWSVGSLTKKLRLRAQVLVNATAPAINFTVGFYPVTVAGAAGVIAYTVGAVVAGSTIALNAPGASAITQGATVDFAVPADGAYVLAVVTSGTTAINSRVAVSAQLQVRNV